MFAGSSALPVFVVNDLCVPLPAEMAIPGIYSSIPEFSICNMIMDNAAKLLTPRSTAAYVAPMVPLIVYKNGPLFWPSLGPATTRSIFSFLICWGARMSMPKMTCHPKVSCVIR